MVNISVIISTYNGKNKIRETLLALESQSYKKFETIIVIDGSIDGTKEMLANEIFSLSSLRIIEQKNQGRACVKNNGAKLANGEILIFYDDDMTPGIDSVQQHLNFHNKNNDAICGGNPIEEETKAITDFDKFRCSSRRKWLEKYETGLNKITHDNLFLSAANFSISKKLFFNIGGFNEKLNDAEDLEFAFRTLNKGYEIYFDNSNIGWHRDFVSCKNNIKRRRDYSNAQNQLRIISPVLFSDKKRIIKMNFFKQIAFSIFSHSFWVNAIDKGYLWFFPQRIRYKIYDLVITGLGSVYPNRPLRN